MLVSDVDSEGAAETAGEILRLGRRALAVRADLGQPDDVLAMMAAVDQEFGRVDILVNNVGIGHRSRPEALSPRRLAQGGRRQPRRHLPGHPRGWPPHDRARGGRTYLSISSIAGSSALGRGNFVYSVTKAGIIQLTRELAVEWAPYRIRVNAIQPAQVMTKAMDRMLADPRLDPATLKERFLRGIPLDRIGEPEDIAKAAIFLVSDAAAFVTGHSLPVDGGDLAFNAGGSKLWPTDP